MEYLKVFTDFAKVLEPLGDAERGRLFTAMLEYAERGTEPDFRGNERFIWPMARLQIDRTVEEYNNIVNKNRENGKKGGRPKNPAVNCENPKNPAVFLETQKSQEKDKDKEKDKDNILPPNNPPKGKGRFAPPSVEEVRAYCQERKNGIDPQAFVDFYSSKGWKVGNNPMKDWKAAVRTWESRRKEEKPVKETSYDMDLINQRFMLGNIK